MAKLLKKIVKQIVSRFFIQNFIFFPIISPYRLHNQHPTSNSLYFKSEQWIFFLHSTIWSAHSNASFNKDITGIESIQKYYFLPSISLPILVYIITQDSQYLTIQNRYNISLLDFLYIYLQLFRNKQKFIEIWFY